MFRFRRRRNQRVRERSVSATVVAALVAGLGAVAAAPGSAAGDQGGDASRLSPFDAVDQFIGTRHDTTQNKGNSAYGNTWPGATLPFGMVQFTPTTHHTRGGDNWGGYEYDADQLRGFGLTRLSGTGCAHNNGAFDVPILPYTGRLTADHGLPTSPADGIGDYYLDFSHDNEHAEPGHYAVGLDNGTDVSLTAAPRTGVATFDFPDDRDSATLVFDVAGSNNGSSASAVTVEGDTVSGWTETRTVCGGGSYRVHFSATFDTPLASHGTWSGSDVTPGGTEAESTFSHGSGAFVTFPRGAEVTARVGVSYVSVENAALNASTEAGDRTAEELRAEAAAAWRDALSTVDVTGGDDAQRTVFYTALYHALLHPNLYDDVNGEYLGYDGTVRRVAEGRHQYATYSGWDSYRGHAQLIALLFPDVGSDINQSLTDLATQTGRWPNWPHNGVSQQKMSGDGLQVMLASIDAFGSTDYDREAALASMVATQTLPADASNRPHLHQYAGLGWVESRNGDVATSKTLEYAINDFAIAQLAGRLGDEDNHRRFMTRAQHWHNVLDPESDHIRPRARDGFDRDFDLGERGDQFEQSTGYQYGWLVPHNLASLIERRGGAEAVTEQLDTFFTELDAGVYGTPYSYLSNEAVFHTPWIYNWLRQPAGTTDVLYRAADEMFDTSPSGLPGNDDLGALSAWYVWASIGLHPSVYGTADLAVSSPMFPRVLIDSAGGDRAIAIDAPGAGTDQRYIQSLAVNGTDSTASWLPESFSRTGGTLDFTMGATPGSWGTGADDVPPSYDAQEDAYNNVGTTAEGRGATGMLDASGNSLSRDHLAAAGATPGAALTVPETGTVFHWPDTRAGEPDNWVPHGQRVDLGGRRGASVSFLGLATNGPAEGTATVVYADGSTQEVPVQFTDWTPGTSYRFGNVPVVTVPGRNGADGGQDTTEAKVFATAPAAVDPDLAVEAVLLPEGSDRGVMHVFDVALGDTAPPAPDETPERVVLTPAADPATEQRVTWRSRADSGAVQLRADDAGEAEEVRTVEAEVLTEAHVGDASFTGYTAALTDLAPDTRYSYRVGHEGAWSPWHAFTTAAAGAEPFTFLYYGDNQQGLDDVWPAIAARANEEYPDARAALYAGDLIDNSHEGEWNTWFAANPAALATQQNLVTVGNHEFNSGNGLLQTNRASFVYPANGPLPSDAGADADRYGEHLATALRDTVYHVDHQDVRFVVLNANRDDICELARPADLADFDCAEARDIWVRMQAVWLDRVLEENPSTWTVVLHHQPVFSAGAGRDEPDIREAWLPVYQEHNVDLVLAGHDHTYARGHVDDDATDTPGLTTGPVYVVADAGAKFYDLQPEDDNVWTRNGATQVVRAQQTSTYQAITVEGETLSYRSVIAHKGDDRAAPGAIGDTLDSFTVTRYADGSKWVTEEGVTPPERPDDSDGPDGPGEPDGPGDPTDPDGGAGSDGGGHAGGQLTPSPGTGGPGGGDGGPGGGGPGGDGGGSPDGGAAPLTGAEARARWPSPAVPCFPCSASPSRH
ncbi:GH92 family glycosyl hydrolase [Streptomyces sedi]|uniref:Alpha-mannosidase n=1 Tax=Streptomyces sedi TaxID=555059 RepID=A0A5C4V574_9ACTN|nr:GH92 family glycosyl hydrolase [Streptomyces sedi]TNM30576.1 alpha-mannosidase [Streptomyces sedi]